MDSPYRLAAVTSHPVQYQAPLFQRLALEPTVDLTVYYGHDGSIAGDVDREFGIPIAWDRPLLAGYRSVFLTTRASRARWWRRAVGRVAIVGHLWRGHYDAVFIHSYATWLSLMAYLGAWLSRTPVLLRTESHGMRPRPVATDLAKSLVLRALFRKTSAFLVIGEANRQFYKKYGVIDGEMFWTPYCADNEYFAEAERRLIDDRAALRYEIGIVSDRPVIVYSGKLIELKRVEDLLQAVKLLSTDGQPADVLIVGDGPCRDVLTQLAATLGLDVKFVGFQNQSQLARYYVCGDMFVLPSSRETWGLVINEAMVFGLPVITTSAVGAGVDLVLPGVTGYLYEAGNCEALAGHLDAFLRDPEARRRMGESARGRIGAYSLTECTNGVLAALRFVSSRRAAQVSPGAAGVV